MSLVKSLSNPNESAETSAVLRVPRLNSLQHRLEHARDAGGKPLSLAEPVLHFLDDPPAGVTDRWKAGAELCQACGIRASRTAVWRFYHKCRNGRTGNSAQFRQVSPG